jgi:hypothetical protein
MAKTKKHHRARPAPAAEPEIIPPQSTNKTKPKQQPLSSVPAKIVDEARKASHHIIDTLAKTALAISSAENAAEKLNVIQSLWNMQKEAEDRQAEREFNVAKVNVAMELPPIPKTKKREFVDKHGALQSSTYADLDDIEGVLDPICRKYGIVKEYSTKTDARGWAAQVCTVRHVSGHKEIYEGSYMPLDTSGSKNNNQAALSTAKYSRRGALIGAFNIFHIDEDLDGALPDDGPKEDKFAQRVQAESAKPEKATGNAMTLPEAAAALESKIRNSTPDKRGAILMKHLNIIDAMEKDAAWHEKAAELRQLCAGEQNQEGGE